MGGEVSVRGRGGALSVRLIVVFGLLLGFGIAAASSAQAFVFKETFGSATQPTFVKPMALAVDQASHDLLVVDVEAKTISRFKADGTPDDFTALGTNVIDGKRSGPSNECPTILTDCDETPQNGLGFGFGNPREVQIVVDNSGGATNGDVYVTQPEESPNRIDIFDKDGSYLGQLTASTEGPLGITAGVGVDSTGAVYASDLTNGKIHMYVPSANPLTNANNTANFAFATGAALAAGLGSTAGSIFASKFDGTLTRLSSTTGSETCGVVANGTITVAVNPANGHVFAPSETKVREFAGICTVQPETPVSDFAPLAGTVQGVAVDGASGSVYVTNSASTKVEVWWTPSLPEPITGNANAVDVTSATLNGTVNPNGQTLTECFFEYLTDEEFDANSEEFKNAATVPCEAPSASEVGSGTSSVSVHAQANGLETGTVYHFQLRTANGNNVPGETVEGGASQFQTLGAQVREEKATQVAATAARLGAKINPNGEATGFQFELVTAAQFAKSEWAEATKVPASQQDIGSGAVPVQVFQQLTSLIPRTTYFFRVVAISAQTVVGPRASFTTFALPLTSPMLDHRAYEMVSPNVKIGEVVPPEPENELSTSCSLCLPGENQQTMPMQNSPDGDSVLYVGQPFSEGLASAVNEYESSRSASEWSWRSLSTPTITGRWEGFSADLSRGIILQTSPPLSPVTPTRGGRAFTDLYLWNSSGSFSPLITIEPPHRDPEGINPLKLRYSGSNSGAAQAPAMTHVIFEANDALTGPVTGVAPAAPEVSEAGQDCSVAHCDLYEWADGQLHLVNVLPDNVMAAEGAALGSGRMLNPLGAVGQTAPNVSNAISADGRKVFWSSEETGHSYARIDGERTLVLPGPNSCKESIALALRSCFLTASADGTKVLLSDGQIYVLNGVETAYVPTVDLSATKGGFDGILGAAADLSHVYFIDSAILTGNQQNTNKEQAAAGQPNLYVYDNGTTGFIGTLLEGDSAPIEGEGDNAFGPAGKFGAWKASPMSRTAQVTNDGRFLAFMSLARLTGYDNSAAGGGSCGSFGGPVCFEVFSYSADTGTLTCVSCNPSGQRPLGRSNLSLLRAGDSSSSVLAQPGNLSRAGEGRVFFESQDVLSAQDTNGNVQDVYEWEPLGIGTCTEPDGCVTLISSGRSTNGSMFVDSDPDGRNAFFITRQQILSRDKDSQLDLYDARIDGGFEEATQGCSGEACRGQSLSPPISSVGGSSGYSGPGNPVPAKSACRSGYVKKQGKCVKKKHRNKKRKRAHRTDRGGAK